MTTHRLPHSAPRTSRSPMAMAAFSCSPLRLPLSPSSSSSSSRRCRRTTPSPRRGTQGPIVASMGSAREEEIVIVGAGIAGLATSLSLCRQEVRAVERRVLLETLANRLPSNTITFSSRLKSIRQEGSGGSILELENGGCINAKIVIGCDGIRSPIANWMGFSEPKYVGHCAFRGLGEYPGGHPHEAKVNYIYGRGIRAGFVPISPTKVYWFICFNSTSPVIMEEGGDEGYVEEVS